MQIKESNFFSTQIPSSLRYEQESEELTKGPQTQRQQKRPSIRVRLAKSQAKKAASLYNQTFRDFMKTKNSLQKNENRTHKLRSDFVKLYMTKKIKYANKLLTEQGKLLENEAKIDLYNKARIKKMNNELGLMYSKNQQEVNNKKTIQENRKFNEDFRKQKIIKRREILDDAKQKYETIKRGQVEFSMRKKNMDMMISTRAHHNYLFKLNQEVQVLQQYTKLLERVNGLKDFDTIYDTESDGMNKTFFITTRNSIGSYPSKQ